MSFAALLAPLLKAFGPHLPPIAPQDQDPGHSDLIAALVEALDDRDDGVDLEQVRGTICSLPISWTLCSALEVILADMTSHINATLNLGSLGMDVLQRSKAFGSSSAENFCRRTRVEE